MSVNLYSLPAGSFGEGHTVWLGRRGFVMALTLPVGPLTVRPSRRGSRPSGDIFLPQNGAKASKMKKAERFISTCSLLVPRPRIWASRYHACPPLPNPSRNVYLCFSFFLRVSLRRMWLCGKLFYECCFCLSGFGSLFICLVIFLRGADELRKAQTKVRFQKRKNGVRESDEDGLCFKVFFRKRHLRCPISLSLSLSPLSLSFSLLLHGVGAILLTRGREREKKSTQNLQQYLSSLASPFGCLSRSIFFSFGSSFGNCSCECKL